MTVSKEIIFEIVSRNKTSHKLLSHYITMYWRQIMLGSKYVNTSDEPELEFSGSSLAEL